MRFSKYKRYGMILLAIVLCFTATIACTWNSENLGELKVDEPTTVELHAGDFLTWNAKVLPGIEYEVIIEIEEANANVETANIDVLSADGDMLADTSSPQGVSHLVFIAPSDGEVRIRLSPPRIASEDFRGTYSIQIIQAT
jgi:hypothetical protein